MEQKAADRRRKIALYIAVWVAAVLILAFLLYRALGLSTVRAQTVTAVRSVEYKIARLDGYIFRDEQVLYSDNTGAAVYLVEDGSRVRADTELCRVYTTGDTSEYLERRRDIEQRLSLLSDIMSLGRTTSGGIDRTQSALDKSYSAVMDALEAGRLDTAGENSRALLMALSARALISGDSLDDEYAAAKQELENLTASYTGTYQSIHNDAACYFFYSCDGYEDAFKVSLIDTVDVQTLRSMAAAPPAYSGQGTPVGKLVGSYEWYLVLAADSSVTSAVEVGNSYTVEIGGQELSMALIRADSAAGVLVFSCGVMPEGFDYARVQSVKLVMGQTAGYRVPLQALHTQQGLDGVYVLSGSQVIFRRVTVLHRGDGYAVVAERDYTTENYTEFLNLNDQIIVSLSDGKLYDGRILD